MVSLDITFLGTSAAMPTADRSLSSIVVNRNGTLHIFDAGEGMQYNFIRANLGFNKRTMLFITHLHSDHILGILGLYGGLTSKIITNLWHWIKIMARTMHIY